MSTVSKYSDWLSFCAFLKGRLIKFLVEFLRIQPREVTWLGMFIFLDDTFTFPDYGGLEFTTPLEILKVPNGETGSGIFECFSSPFGLHPLSSTPKYTPFRGYDCDSLGGPRSDEGWVLLGVFGLVRLSSCTVFPLDRRETEGGEYPEVGVRLISTLWDGWWLYLFFYI